MKQQCRRYSFTFIFYDVDINLHYALLTSLTGTRIAQWVIDWVYVLDR